MSYFSFYLMPGKEPSGSGQIKGIFISLLDASLYLHCIYIMVKETNITGLRRSNRTRTKPQQLLSSKKQKECPQKTNPVNPKKSDSAEYGTSGIRTGAIGGTGNVVDVLKENPTRQPAAARDVAAVDSVLAMGRGRSATLPAWMTEDSTRKFSPSPATPKIAKHIVVPPQPTPPTNIVNTSTIRIPTYGEYCITNSRFGYVPSQDDYYNKFQHYESMRRELAILPPPVATTETPPQPTPPSDADNLTPSPATEAETEDPVAPPPKITRGICEPPPPTTETIPTKDGTPS